MRTTLRMRGFAAVVLLVSCGGPANSKRGATTVPTRDCDPIERAGKPVTEAQARALAQKVMTETVASAMVLHDHERRAFGWVYWFVPDAFQKTGDPNQMIPGVGPIAVHQADGAACMLAPHPGAVDGYEDGWRSSQANSG